MATTDLKINALDFDDIKENLKTYLKSQNQFKDYDFEGSGLNVLLDILAYNTHYGAFYANMVANETFLDSALFRPSVNSIAKHLNYLPKSYRSAVAYVDVEYLLVPESDPADAETLRNILNGNEYITIGDQFVGVAGENSYIFTAASNTKIELENGRYFARNVEIKEGYQKTLTYIYDENSNVDQKFIIPDINIDTSSLLVRVSQSITNTEGIENLWNLVTDINKLTSESKVFFLQVNQKNEYELFFGDGIIGKKPLQGNVISIFYRACNGSLANGIGTNDTSSISSFRYLGRNSSATTLQLDSNGKYVASFGGSEPEELNSIKYFAPRNYQAQERAVTTEDYRTLLTREYGEQAESVFVWGGEDNEPPIFGKVFVSIKPKNAVRLTQLQKLAIAKSILKERNLVSIIPEVVDPDYIYLVLNLNIKYDASKTILSRATLEDNIKNLIYQYGQENIGKFDRNFVESLFVTYVNVNYNPPVVSCSADLKLKKAFEPNLTAITTYTINFDNEFYHPVDGYESILTTSSFGYQDLLSEEIVKPAVDSYLDDDGRGNIRIFKIVDGLKVYMNNFLGTIDYTTGKIVLKDFIPQYLNPETQTEITMTVTPKYKDVECRRNQILLLELEDLNVTASPQTLRYDPYFASGSAFNRRN